MGKYIFLTNQYLPKPGATGLCIHQLAKHLAAEGNEVFTVCYNNDDHNVVYDGVKVKRIKVPGYLGLEDRVSPVQRWLQKWFSCISKLIHIRRYPLRSSKLVSRYQQAIGEILKDGTSAKIIASYTPLEAVATAAKVKKIYKEKVKFIYYCADTMSNEQGEAGILSASYRKKCGIHWEQRLFSVCDRIIVMECHKEHYFSEEYKEHWNKMEVANFPLFSKRETSTVGCAEKETVSLVYAGTLYRVLRNPQFLCDCLVQLCKELKIKVDFLGSGDCTDILKVAEKAADGSICTHGMQSYETAVEFLENADVLLSIGNAKSPMAPSKIYEYMTTGKPIIHTYTYEEDPCLQPLRKYGNALLIREGETGAVEMMREFIVNRKNLDYRDVEKEFYTSTPQYTVDIFKRCE